MLDRAEHTTHWQVDTLGLAKPGGEPGERSKMLSATLRERRSTSKS